jgi:hypothetical protein
MTNTCPEKAIAEPAQDPLLAEKETRRARIVANIFRCCLFLCLLKYIIAPYYNALVPARKAWHACNPAVPSEFDCRSVQVPYDWDNASHPGVFTLPLLRLKATGEKLGSVFVNPGGPGASGINFMLRKGRHMHSVLQGAL